MRSKSGNETFLDYVYLVYSTMPLFHIMFLFCSEMFFLGRLGHMDWM